MRFKIHGEKEENDKDKDYTNVVEILEKKAIEKFIDDKLYAVSKDLERQISLLRERVDKLEEEVAIKRRELLKLEGKRED